MKHHYITGVAGFIGSQLADALLAEGARVSGIDDFSLGRREHLAQASAHTRFRLVEGDCSDFIVSRAALEEVATWEGVPDLIWHLAANSDISAGVSDPGVDFSRTLTTTFATLEAARTIGAKRLAFASTSAVYGERDDVLTENSGPLLPISCYGATKLGSEALISAAAESFLERIWIFRFPNIVGRRSTHGAIHDFVAKLRMNPASLKVLGDGSQTKPYLHVSELIAAMRYIVKNAEDRRNVFNIGPEDEGTNVRFMAEQTVARMAPGLPITFSGGDRGWVGDVPRFRYSTARLAHLGWRCKLTSDEAVLCAIDDIIASFRE